MFYTSIQQFIKVSLVLAQQACRPSKGPPRGAAAPLSTSTNQAKHIYNILHLQFVLVVLVLSPERRRDVERA